MIDIYLIKNALARLSTEPHVIVLEYDENERFEAVIVIACSSGFPFPSMRLIGSLFQIKSDAYPRQIPNSSISVATEKCVEVTRRSQVIWDKSYPDFSWNGLWTLIYIMFESEEYLLPASSYYESSMTFIDSKLYVSRQV